MNETRTRNAGGSARLLDDAFRKTSSLLAKRSVRETGSARDTKPFSYWSRRSGFRRLRRISDEKKRKCKTNVTRFYMISVRNCIKRWILCCLVEWSSTQGVYSVRNLSHSCLVCCSILIGRLAPAQSLVIGGKATPPEAESRPPSSAHAVLQKDDLGHFTISTIKTITVLLNIFSRFM